jgi:hypothetical protein
MLLTILYPCLHLMVNTLLLYTCMKTDLTISTSASVRPIDIDIVRTI